MICPICLEKMGKNKHVLECGHLIHTECLLQLLENGLDFCPFCRFYISVSPLFFWKVRLKLCLFVIPLFVLLVVSRPVLPFYLCFLGFFVYFQMTEMF